MPFSCSGYLLGAPGPQVLQLCLFYVNRFDFVETDPACHTGLIFVLYSATSSGIASRNWFSLEGDVVEFNHLCVCVCVCVCVCLSLSLSLSFSLQSSPQNQRPLSFSLMFGRPLSIVVCMSRESARNVTQNVRMFLSKSKLYYNRRSVFVSGTHWDPRPIIPILS
jgi:hypothetical protein